jgi:hypothetical protein
MKFAISFLVLSALATAALAKPSHEGRPTTRNPASAAHCTLAVGGDGDVSFTPVANPRGTLESATYQGVKFSLNKDKSTFILSAVFADKKEVTTFFNPSDFPQGKGFLRLSAPTAKGDVFVYCDGIDYPAAE